jgi:mRNA-degrading endonuclease toxin of MazEF toxin-antitoxin module
MAILRGEIYFVDLNPVQGREQAGRRPVLVISIDAIYRRPLVVTVVVGTSGQNIPKDYPITVRVPREEADCLRRRYSSVSRCAPSTKLVFQVIVLAGYRRPT